MVCTKKGEDHKLCLMCKGNLPCSKECMETFMGQEEDEDCVYCEEEL